MSSEEEERKQQDDLDKKVVAFDPNIIGARTDSFKSTRVGGALGHMTVLQMIQLLIVWVDCVCPGMLF